jgi:adenylosuccinate synthase
VKDGIDVEGRLYVSDRAHLVMPYHKLVDKESHSSKAIGTTGRGIGPAYEDKAGRRGVRVIDLKHPDRLRPLVERGCEYANLRLKQYKSDKHADADYTMGKMEEVANRLISLSQDLGVVMHRAIAHGASILLEGAQGSLLDVDHGTYPFVTSSSTTVGGAATGAGVPPMALHAALGIVKAYTTRVGNGPLPTELEEPLGTQIRELGNEFGATTGRPRRCGWFDAVVVRYASRVNGLTGLAVTKLDVLDTIDRIALCTGYRVGEEVLSEFPADITALDGLEPVYEWMDGWRMSTAAARSIADLPAPARRYLERIEALVETPIRYVSVGTRRDQIIDASGGR